MKKFFIGIKNGNKSITTNETENDFFSLEIVETDERFTVTIKPKKAFELTDFYVEMPYGFSKGDKFFAAGYQSWTVSREYSADDIMRGMIRLASINKKVRYIASLTSDENIVKYSEKRGEFHSHGYTYIRNGERVKLFGSLCEETGFTYFKVKMKENLFGIHKDVLGKVVTEEIKLLDVVSYEGGYDEVFDKYFSHIKCSDKKNETMCGYTSWYNYFQNINEDIILRDLDGLDFACDKVSVFQIDDGYEPFVGDWLEPDLSKFPHGMKYIADKVHEKGYKAGLWLAPFSCQKRSKTAKEHPDWLVRDKSGKPYLGVMSWGGAYILDIYNQEVQDYLNRVFDTVLNVWGFDMVKLDFLYSQCILPRNGKSRGEIMHDALVFLRKAVGDKILLGCGVPMTASFGIADACRISCDVDLSYKDKIYNRIQVSNEMLGAQHAINNSIFRRHLNGRAFMNDPDVFFLRNDNLKFTHEQKLLLAEINNLCGNVLFVSDNAGDYDSEQRELLKKFFEKTDKKIISAEYTDKNNITIITEAAGKRETLSFNIKTGAVKRSI